MVDDLATFLGCETPDAWLAAAQLNQAILLIDHAQCEKKAASTAMSLMYRYVDRYTLLRRMSKLAREELVHFDQVIQLLKKRNIAYQHLSASRYAAGLLAHLSTKEPQRLVDRLIIGAFVEARSCERFARLAPLLDDELARFYQSLLASERRHYQHYLALAQQYSPSAITERVEYFRQVEQQLIQSSDAQFRFHSGCPDVIAHQPIVAVHQTS